jgi:hypothetical protein
LEDVPAYYIGILGGRYKSLSMRERKIKKNGKSEIKA